MENTDLGPRLSSKEQKHPAAHQVPDRGGGEERRSVEGGRGAAAGRGQLERVPGPSSALRPLGRLASDPV